ncbi:hypothetical protein GDO86_010339, partial [Hymenochirus boettgeri]
SIEECITLLRSIADNIELFHRRATIANIAGSSAGIAGGITTIVGLALTPFTFGASLIVSLVGISVASAGGLTGAVSSIADTANIYKNGKRVEKIIKDIDRDIKCMETLLESIREQLEDIRRLQGVNKFEIMTASTRGASIAIGITRVAELVSVTSNVARGAQLAARGLQALTAVSGVLAAAFLLVDIGLVTKNAIDLRNGATLEKAQKIRDVADDLERQFGNLQAEVTEVQKLFRQPYNKLSGALFTNKT